MSYPRDFNQDDGDEVTHTFLFVPFDGSVIGFLVIMGFKPVINGRGVQLLRSQHGMGVGW